MLVRNARHIPDIYERQRRVRRRLDPYELRVRAYALSDFDLDGGAEGDYDIVGGRDFGEVAVRAAVDVGDRDNVGAAGEGLQDVGCGCGAGGKGEGVASVFKGCDGFLEVVAGGALAISI
jgi:hypothetical protein